MTSVVEIVKVEVKQCKTLQEVEDVYDESQDYRFGGGQLRRCPSYGSDSEDDIVPCRK